MAVSETDTSDCNSDSSPDGMMSKERKERPFTKAIIRRLPPSMTKETFLEQVSPLPDYDYMYFVKADISLGEYAFSRAYVNFKNSSDIFLFKEKFDNYVFLDAKGNEYPAVVEFAPFSRIPRKRNKIRVDPKCGSIETDQVYLDFLESLKEVENNENEEKPEYCFQPSIEEEKQKVINTPLLEFIKQRRLDRQKIREEKQERKRKELERKRYKEEERRRRTDRRPESSYHQGKTISSSKNVQILNLSKDSQNQSTDEKKDVTPVVKERKYDDTKYEKKYEKSYKDDRKYSSYQKPKEYKKMDDPLKKSPSKLRERAYEKSGIKQKYEVKRKEDSYKSKKEYSKETNEEEKTTEKKVKKYSERREERKNEIKKMETSRTDDSKKEYSDKKEEVKKDVEQKDDRQDYRTDKTEEECKNSSKCDDDKNDDEQNCGKGCKENDPRSQRRIRNKDRPSLVIYQPGMGLGRNRNKSDNNDKTESS